MMKIEFRRKVFCIYRVKNGGDPDVVDVIIEASLKDSEFKDCWGVILKKEGVVVRSPIYPFVSNYCHLDALNDFVELYSEDLVRFYETTNGLDFGRFLYGFETDIKEDFRNHWFKKGVVIY